MIAMRIDWLFNGVFEESIMIYTLISLLFFFWLVGLVAHIGGGFIHMLLVLAVVIFLFDLITGRRTSV
jgi:hypothetical protein